MSDAPPASHAGTERRPFASSSERVLIEDRLQEGEQLVDGEVRWSPNDVY